MKQAVTWLGAALVTAVALIATALAVAASVLVGCGRPAAAPSREGCYAAAEMHATGRALAECRGAWSTCPVRPAILDELAQSERSCP